MDFFLMLYGFLFLTLVIVVSIIVWGKVMQAKSAAINSRSFEELATELKTELAAIKENLDSINKMMKEIE